MGTIGGRATRAWRLGAAAAAVACLAGLTVPLPARAGANRCETGPPERSPTWVDGAGNHWFDEHGLWTQGPDGSMFGGLGIDADRRAAEIDAWSNHSLQVHVSEARQCVAVGPRSVGGSDAGEFTIGPAAEAVALPWLARDGNLVRASDGRTTILRGVDYPYNQEIFEAPYNLTESDFDRIASWGLNLLRIRISSARSGFLPGTTPEQGYWEQLDRIIAAANRRGIYVMPSTVTADWEAMSTTSGHDQLKFVAGTASRAWWVQYQRSLFERYRDWPGVVGFDPLNEDNSYPPFVHDQRFMGPLHREADAALRGGGGRQIYFQEPSGWSYWGAEWWPEMMQGTDTGDPNRFYCPKYKPGGSGDSELQTKGRLATESGVPMFFCEIWVDNADPATVRSWQRDSQRAMDAKLIGGVRVLYGPSAGYGTHTRDGVEAHWIPEFTRPYPLWAGGRVTGVTYDYDTRSLTTQLQLDGSGPSELFVSVTRTYPEGFVATGSDGSRLVHDGTAVVEASGLSWDAARQRVVAPAATSALTVTVAPLP